MLPQVRRLVFGFSLFLAVCTLAVDLAQAAAETPGPRTLRDLPYVEHGTPRQKLDLYLPAEDGKTHPLLIWVHGGGWSMGNRYPCPSAALTSRGYAVASVGYRFSQDAIFPAQIEDCKAAVRWLRAHAAEYHLDPAHIGAAGESAGGHLVALLGTTGDQATFDVGTNLDQSSAVQCVIDLYGPSDFLHYGDATLASLMAHDPNNGGARLLGGPIDTHQEAARQASPVYDVNKDSAPFLIFQGDHDNLVPAQQSELLHDALVKAGVDATLKIVPDAGHGGPQFIQPENLALMVSFLEKYLLSAHASVSP